MPAKVIKSNGVPVGRYYSAIAVVATVVGILAFLAGKNAGEADARLESAQLDLQNQKEVYTNDLLVDKEKPDSRDYAKWLDGMYNLLP